jgi:hypothetical protein
MFTTYPLKQDFFHEIHRKPPGLGEICPVWEDPFFNTLVRIMTTRWRDFLKHGEVRCF